MVQQPFQQEKNIYGGCKMNTIYFKNKKTEMIAHRGLSALERENTNAAFVAAGNRSYFGIETDVYATKDGVFVLHHDAMTKEGQLVIEEQDYETLKQVVMCDVDGELRNDLVLPLLTDYIRICKKYNKKAILEIKPKMDDETVARLVDEIRQQDYLSGTIFISFHWDNLIRLRALLPNQPLQFLVQREEEYSIEQLVQHQIDLDIYHKSVTKKMVKEIHKNGLLINCWTCNHIKDAERMVACGVDFITTNVLEGK
ncbi:MAG: hypothetical protein E7399_08865 [Ruminococcaceae bacterium]|nr:hypothetical protein [Oscillospiraceae bacterium]